MSEPTIILHRKHFDALPLELQHTQDFFSLIVYPINNATDEIAKEMLLKKDNWGKIVFQLSNGRGLESNIEQIRQSFEKSLLAEIEFAKSISKQKITKFFYQLTTEKYANLPRILYAKSKNSLFLLGTDMTNWHLWNCVRGQADYSSSIRLALEMTREIPAQTDILRWLGEPIHCLIIPTELFSFNVETGYQELTPEHEKLIGLFVILKVTTENPLKLQDYYESLVYYIKQSIYTGTVCKFRHDVLMIPLQPLFENLSNCTYELFEKDPAKYDLYQKAIQSALIDLIPENHEFPAVLMIVGAGRGPLVRACINAGVVTKRKVKIFIVEKNPSAIITLNALKHEIWSKSDVTIFAEDMRTFNPPEKADILVSELLGSFGCNELSPECLDGAQKHLKPQGVSIPVSYTSFVNPIMSSKIYEYNLMLDRHYHPRDKSPNVETDFECNYIVCPKSVFHIAEPQALFTFSHPNNAAIIDNSRYKSLKFNVAADAVLHGFLGYFEAVLYKEHMISILPATHTEGMISWHCYYFPIKNPQQIRDGETIEVDFWRRVTKNKVWYEWTVVAPNMTLIHNLNGRSFPIFK